MGDGGTSYNRTVYAPLPSVAPGFHSPRSLRSHGSFHPHFVGPANATHLLIRADKTSYTAETLCAIGFGVTGHIGDTFVWTHR
jgi:hypothetical protein